MVRLLTKTAYLNTTQALWLYSRNCCILLSVSEIRPVDSSMLIIYKWISLKVAFLQNEKGATAIEYALIAGFVSIAILGGIQSLGDGLSSMFNAINSAMN